MTNEMILSTCKKMLFGSDTGTFRDDLLNLYINEVIDFMKNAGVAENVIRADSTVGVIALGVNDLWNYQAGGVKLSEYFKTRVVQLAAAELDDTTTGGGV